MKRSYRIMMPLLFLSIASFLISCQPIQSSYQDVVATYHSPHVNFAGYKTYNMPDSVVLIGNQSTQATLSGKYQKQILNLINSNMISFGYTKVSTKDSADLIILPTVAICSGPFAVNSGYSIYNYWGWYEPDWDYDWGWDYGWEVTSYYTYQTGTLIIQMVDNNNPSNNNKKLNCVWAAYINGVIYNNENITQALNTDINQAYTQSQYLIIN